MSSTLFQCQRCGHCCQGESTVSLTQNEIEGIASFLRMTVDETFSKYLVKKGKRVEMKIVDGHCIFFNQDGLCSIHPVKPFHCRRWPLHPSILGDEGAWEAIKADCPGFDPGVTYEMICAFLKESHE